MLTALLILYFSVLSLLALMGLYRLFLAMVAFFSARSVRKGSKLSAWPKVVVQLPLYNEAFVVERLLRQVARFRYEGAWEIQVLDDSTDETCRIARRVVDELAKEGLSIQWVRRPERKGYKAGALAYGLSLTDAEVVAVFDADFLPPSDFLERIVPVLWSDRGCGMVQACWGHTNRGASLLTRVQAVLLDGHFAIEHRARFALGHFFNFNGTAGIWRRQAIEDAGGWSADTITEDLDLSYRSQLAGWRFKYIEDVIAPAELPESWLAFQAQQARWVQGSMETARKLVPRFLKARDLGFGVRLHALTHLMNNLAYLLMAVLATLLPATVFVRDQTGWVGAIPPLSLLILDLTFLGGGIVAMVIFYVVADLRMVGRLSFGRLIDIFFALAVGAGMSLSNARAAWRGLSSRGSQFMRTPKQGETSKARVLKVYPSGRSFFLVCAELGFLFYFALAVGYAIFSGRWGAVPFLSLYLIGFFLVGLGHFNEYWLSRRPVKAVDRSASSLRLQDGPT